jgi:hypothetical protein
VLHLTANNASPAYDVKATSQNSSGRSLLTRGRYLRTIRFNAIVREACGPVVTWGDFGVVAMVRLVIALLVVVGRRLRHPRVHPRRRRPR